MYWCQWTPLCLRSNGSRDRNTAFAENFLKLKTCPQNKTIENVWFSFQAKLDEIRQILDYDFGRSLHELKPKPVTAALKPASPATVDSLTLKSDQKTSIGAVNAFMMSTECLEKLHLRNKISIKIDCQ
jgi:hypothetical protein